MEISRILHIVFAISFFGIISSGQTWGAEAVKIPGPGSTWQWRMHYHMLGTASALHTVSVLELHYGRPVFTTTLGGRTLTLREEGDHILALEDGCRETYVPKPPSGTPNLCGWNPCTIAPNQTIVRPMIVVSSWNRCVPVEGKAHYKGISAEELLIFGKRLYATKTEAKIEVPGWSPEWTPFIADGKGEIFATSGEKEARYERIDVQLVAFKETAHDASVPEPLKKSSEHPPVAAHTIQSEKERWLALGDSITTGICAEKEETYPSVLEQLLAPAHNIEIVNAGIPGRRSSDLIGEIGEIVQLRPSVVLLAIGANDILSGIAVRELEHNLISVTTYLKTRGARVILLGLEVDDQSPYAGVYRRVAAQAAVEVVPNILDGVWGNPRYRCNDGLHFTAEGYRKIAENIFAALHQ